MPRRTVEKVEAELAEFLAENAPELGDRLPPERELAARLRCSRETLRKSLDNLEKRGDIWRHVGQGTFRGPRPRYLPTRETLLVEGATPPDLMRARLVLEPQVAAEAARRVDKSDVTHLWSLVAAGRIAKDRSDAEQADDAFHRAMAQATRNPVLIGFLNYLSGARRRATWQRQWDRTYRRLGVDEFRTLHSDQHGRVVEAVAAADPEAASSAMVEHLNTIMSAMSRD
ncbi:FadR/GntR family transcriptional regulator [Roseibium sp.]|uniref:FadR/GntR family transcriptional regulator n=1 Tax=Roseibium sp. TaxID=1936156 RepID=UPI003D0F4FE2